ncbi:beta-propeller domain-containing protein [Candidatus Peribacteria bacterium]|nr:beta-propeller domain-containing protein [Candidatus Peribacteria bacterium]
MKITKNYLANISQSGSDASVDIRDHKGGLITRLDRSFFQVPSDQYYSIQSILATDNRLVVIGDMPAISENKDITSGKRMMPIFYANKSVVSIYDMNSLATPKFLKQITLPSYSQQIYLNKDTLLIVTNGMNNYQADTGKYPLPRIIETQDGKTKTRAIDCGNYQFFSGALDGATLPNLTTILTQDIADTTKSVKDSGFIGSPNSTYFTGDRLFANLIRDRSTSNSCPPGKMCAMIWNPTIMNTDIYGFELKNGTYQLQARASVIGRVGSDYSMNLKDNVLTVISEESNMG